MLSDQNTINRCTLKKRAPTHEMLSGKNAMNSNSLKKYDIHFCGGTPMWL